MRIEINLAVGLVLLAPAAAFGQGQVRGAVLDDAAKPVAGAAVFLTAFPTPGEPLRSYSANAKTGADGAFSFSGVPAGRYAVCAQGTGDFLHSCLWSAQPLRVNVGEGQTASAAVTLQRGHRLRVRFADATGALSARDAAGTSVLVTVGPAAVGLLPLQRGASTATSREYEALVPFDTALKVTVRSPLFRVRDDKGADVDVDRGHEVAVTARRANPPAAIQFAVAGVQAGR